jgi:L-lactate dehydrogenase complex protein LldG
MARDSVLARLGANPQTAAFSPPVTLFGQDLCHLGDRIPEGESLLTAFSTRLGLLSGELHVCKNLLEGARRVHELLTAQNVNRIALATDSLVETVTRVYKPLSELCESGLSGPQLSGPGLADCEVGISGCDALIARTGSVALRSSRAGGRRLSVLVPTHIVLARQSQLVPDLSTWLATLPEDQSWGSAHIISGPSRTADIEKVLVLGAHGPKRLVVVLVG